MWELSTPLMYVRWLMLKAGLSNSSLMPLVNVAFMLVFFGCRNVWGPSECCMWSCELCPSACPALLGSSALFSSPDHPLSTVQRHGLQLARTLCFQPNRP
jgi:hypothetical protein